MLDNAKKSIEYATDIEYLILNQKCLRINDQLLLGFHIKYNQDTTDTS